MPDTGWAVSPAFTRYYFAQADVQGAVIDELQRWQAGSGCDQVLNRKLMGWWSPRLARSTVLRQPRSWDEGDDHQ
jgi:hypothetical protein